uniref:CSON004415 protein n=1 Tax=Culicoides sonorensis TaxID=179676 RepID=A0A336MUX2_CULSO
MATNDIKFNDNEISTDLEFTKTCLVTLFYGLLRNKGALPSQYPSVAFEIVVGPKFGIKTFNCGV